MYDNGSAVAVISPADMLTAEHMDPETRALLLFLANRTANTRTAYELDLKAFMTWSRGFGVPSMLLCQRMHLELYLEHLKSRGIAPATVARRFNTVKLFLRLAYEESIITDDPAKRVRVPKVDHERQRRTWLSTVAMARVMEVAHASAYDYALMMWMTNTAMRVGEVCALDVEDIHREPTRVWVGFVGKGNKYARVDLPYAVVAALDEYLDGRTTGPLFVNGAGHRLTRNNVDFMLQRLVQTAGVTVHDTAGTGKVTPHGIRRTHAKTLAEHGADLLDIAESLRHVDARTTRQSYIGTATGRANMARQKATDIFTGMSG